MLCAIIKGPSLENAQRQIESALPNAECLELRLDFFDSLDIAQLRQTYSHIPMVFTLRISDKRTEAQRLEAISQLCSLKPEFFDIEVETDKNFLKNLQLKHPSICWILSYHNFEETPKDLNKLLGQIRSQKADIYKIAVFAKDACDTFKLINATRNSDLIPISMGPSGLFSRMLPSPMMYAPADDSCFTAPGQLTLKEFCNTYHIGKTHVPLGLIGNKVDVSVSHLSHNAMMRELKIPGSYSKIHLEPEQLGEFMELAKKSPLHGLSVTMPHKEAIIPYLDEIDPTAKEIGAVNTLIFQNGRVKGYNTDATGAIEALEQPLTGKKVVLLGAGGAAKAIAYEARKRGADVILLTRDPSKHVCDGKLDDFGKFPHDIVINCTPSRLPIDVSKLREGCTVMDITTMPKETELLILAKERGCKVVYGYRMFVNQAVEQFHLWFGGKYDREAMRRSLTVHCERVLCEG